MFEHPRLKAVLARFESLIFKVHLQMGAFGLQSQKDTILIGTAPYLHKLARRMTHAEKEAMRESSDHVQTTVRYEDSKGIKRCVGTKDLKKTQAYPLSFGAAHALAYHYCVHEAKAQLCPALDPEDTDDSDLEGDDALIDIWSNKPNYWHSNMKGEQKLQLLCSP
jgi:hypothetical protein